MTCAAVGYEVNVRRRGGGLDLERLKRRILKNIEIDPVTGCWIWKGRRNNQGYPEMTIRIPSYAYPRKFLVHRVAFELWVRPLKRGQVVAHSTCDNPPCCNWEHTKATTQRMNLKECREKGRRSKKLYRVDDELIRPLLEPHLLPRAEATA